METILVLCRMLLLLPLILKRLSLRGQRNWARYMAQTKRMRMVDILYLKCLKAMARRIRLTLSKPQMIYGN